VRVDGVRTRRETLIYAQVLFVVAAAVAALRGDGRSRSRGPNIRGGIRELHELVRTWNLFTSLYWCCGGTNPFFRPVPFGFYPYYYGPFGGYGYGYGYPYGYGYGLGSALRHARRRRNIVRTRAVVRDGVVVAVPAEEVPRGEEDLPVATAVDEEALLDDDGDASPAPPTQSDDALSALHAFLFGGPGAKSADHWRRVAAVVASRGGVIAPEDLAPHLPAPPMNLRGSEAAAAVAVAHFRGRPRRCEEGGGVVFEFPELVGGAPADGDDALCEAPVPFAGLSFERTLCCAGLVGGNVLALWVLRGAVDGALARAAAFFYYYSLAILAIPLGRFAAFMVANRRRDRRNATRRALADELRRLRDEDSSGVAARVRFAARCSM
jgi:hypothetical protein